MPSARQKKKIRKIASNSIAIIIFFIGVWFLYQKLQYRKAKFTRYPEFGINIPENYSIHGIDVSKYQ
jgi:lysozyme